MISKAILQERSKEGAISEGEFPVDIFAVKEYGVERWRKDFFWPVSDSEYIRLF